MSRFRTRLLLLMVIILELMVAAVVLWWLFGVDDEPLPEIVLDAITAYSPPPTVPIASTARTIQATSLGLAGDVPAALVDVAREWAGSAPDELTWTGAANADLVISWAKGAEALSLADIVFVPIASFYSLRDTVTFAELRRTWQAQLDAEDTPAHVFVSPETAAALDAVFGPRSAQAPVSIVSAVELTDRLWTEANALAIVPFDQLEPRFKILSMDGLSILDRDLELDSYPLIATVWANGPADRARSLAAQLEAQELYTNRHLDRLTVVAMTGVTALTRLVAYKMETVGDYSWPAWYVADFLSSADLTHVSNEVSFMPGCQVELDTWAFCAKPEYLETLHLVGADLVELTGNHNLDFGPQYALLSLDLYAQAGMQTFGGGRNATEARQPLLITHNGNRLAFLGYSQFGPDYAWATDARPGAARFSPESVQADLSRVRPQADVVFVNIQHTEAYEPTPLPEQVSDFQAVARAGADVITGSQAHQPQTIEFYGNKPIFYGLGNLFFDQTWSDPTRQGLIVRHFIYDGQLISSQVIPTIIDDNFQTHLAQGQERTAILQTVFSASDRP